MELPLPRRSSRTRRVVFGIKILGILTFLTTIGLIFGLTFHTVDLLGQIGAKVNSLKPSPRAQRSFKHPCGLTATSARAAGCVFDVMSMAWQAQECFDADLHESFMLEGPWEFYSSPDPSGRRMTEEEISEAGVVSWTTRRYFVTHCVYGWKAMHRAWQRGWRMDANLASIEHTELCSRVFMNTSVPLEMVTTRLHVDFPSCN
ncbi:hypothetical protein EJ06DRAFT_469889 [Trichodelitschia bisporula]|uniref:Uncharacterized protein n=1 Tax=Trichodelitschia bisporula TaxID=703511 RepID=A0A6G1I8C2_9PEZI|nr:hypothetical protein EJ06DRAFT_469889 [Trichodelitschia bisporula]